VSGNGDAFGYCSAEGEDKEGGNAAAVSPGMDVGMLRVEFARGVQVGRGVGDAVSASQATNPSAAAMRIVAAPRRADKDMGAYLNSNVRPL
jgi:hypothetical protein